MKTVKNDCLKAKKSVPYPNTLDTKYPWHVGLFESHNMACAFREFSSLSFKKNSWEYRALLFPRYTLQHVAASLTPFLEFFFGIKFW